MKEWTELQTLLAPRQQPTPVSMIRFGDGQSVSLQEWLTVEEFKEKREDRRQDRENSKERFKVIREGFGDIVGAISRAAAELRDENGLPAAGTTAKPSPALVVQVACDKCGAMNTVQITDRATPPKHFECGACHTVNDIVYGPAEEAPRQPAGAAPAPAVEEPVEESQGVTVQ